MPAFGKWKIAVWQFLLGYEGVLGGLDHVGIVRSGSKTLRGSSHILGNASYRSRCGNHIIGDG